MRTNEERLGNHIIRWQENEDGTYSGAAVSNGKMGEVLHDESGERLRTRLRNLAGTLEPNYFGMEDAIARFLEFMPGGFGGEHIREEREYKLKASNKLKSVLTPEHAASATPADASQIRAASVWINLLSPYESMHLKEALEGVAGCDFLKAASKFAAGDVNAGAEGMRRAMKAHGPLTWPIAAYFPFLWAPESHMFLKPSVTRDFAERTGHPFQYAYDSEIRREVYESLLDLAQQTKREIGALHPCDNIDVQSFIWVVGSYTDADRRT